MGSRNPTLALAFATIERPQVVQRLVLSVRKYFPELPIYVADQSRDVEAMRSFYEANGVTLVRMPYDAGVSASRNRLVRAAVEEYVILCDDDFVFGEQTGFDDAVRILDGDDEIGVVGGRLFDFDEGAESIRNWELYLEYDARQKILFSIPIYDLAPKVREIGAVRYYLCDAVMNFAVFRRSIFAEGVSWDERFRSNGEHEDFYLSLKMGTSHKVAYLPTMIAYHHHPEVYRTYRAGLRDRNEGWKLFLEKWGLEQHIEFGLGVRTVDNINEVKPSSEARARFFVNPELSLHRAESLPGAILLGDYTKIAAVGVLDKSGRKAARNGGSGRLLIESRTSALVAAPGDTTERAAGSDDVRSAAELLERYALEPANGGQAVGSAQDPIFFRYDPLVRKNVECFLWYICPQATSSPKSRRRLAVIMRWSDIAGVLVWRSRRMFIDLHPQPYWRPLFLEVPVFPRDRDWLRFDVISDGTSSPNPVATGFLFRSPGERSAVTGDVLGLGRLPNDGATPGVKGQELRLLGRDCPVRSIEVEDPSNISAMSLLNCNRLDGLEALYFVGWDESLGRTLVSARLPSTDFPAPAALALPKAGWSASQSRLFGYGQSAGFVSLSWRDSTPFGAS